MNRTILIVICDFLLLSLLVFSSVDVNKVTEKAATGKVKVGITTNRVERGNDLGAVMRLALDDERQHRNRLLGELASARAAMSERDKQVQTFQQELQEREKQVQTFQQQLQAREQDATRLQAAQTNLQQQAARLEAARNNLQQQVAAAQTNLQALNQQLHSNTVEAVVSKERLAAMEAEARKQAEQAAALRRQLAQLSKSNAVVVAERQQLAGQLQVAQAEKRLAVEHAAQMREEVKVERAEKAKLAEGVKVLASRSGELAKEIRENRPLASNTIFSEFLTNRVQARFSGSRPGLFGEAIKNRETETVLATDGTNTFALCHVQDTPLTFFNPGTEWEGFTGTLGHGTARCALRTLSFGWPDPRIVLMPVTAAEVRQLGSKVYRISSDPYKFQDAVLVGTREGYYGECRFQIDLSTPGYVRLDNSFLKGLFGKFNPSRGDLVFSKTGELLGIMANDSYCMMLQRFDATATFNLSSDVRAQHTGETLARLYAFVNGMPFKLQ